MTLTTRDVVTSMYGLEELREDSSVVLPAKISYVINLNFRALLPIVKEFEEARAEIIRASGKADGEFTEQDMNEINAQIDSVLDMKVNVNLTTIDVNDLDGFNISVKYMNALYMMISSGQM